MAQLPKPLSEKSIQKMLSGWKPATVDKLHAYFAAFANFFGSLTLEEAWVLFKTYESGVKKKEFFEFSSIARREELPYYILEIDEVYSDEKRSMEERIIAHKSLVGEGYNRFFFLVNLENFIYDNNLGFYLPDDILKYVDHDGLDENEFWKEFSDLINSLKTPSGVPLGESTELTRTEKFDLEYYKAEYKKKKLQEEFNSSPLGHRLLEKYKSAFHMGWAKPEYVFKDMEDNDIELTEFDKKRIENLFKQIFDTACLWCNRGLSKPNMLNIISPNDGMENPDELDVFKALFDKAGISFNGLDGFDGLNGLDEPDDLDD
jgi:hypothetical protein